MNNHVAGVHLKINRTVHILTRFAGHSISFFSLAPPLPWVPVLTPAFLVPSYDISLPPAGPFFRTILHQIRPPPRNNQTSNWSLHRLSKEIFLEP